MKQIHIDRFFGSYMNAECYARPVRGWVKFLKLQNSFHQWKQLLKFNAQSLIFVDQVDCGENHSFSVASVKKIHFSLRSIIQHFNIRKKNYYANITRNVSLLLTILPSTFNNLLLVFVTIKVLSRSIVHSFAAFTTVTSKLEKRNTSVSDHVYPINYLLLRQRPLLGIKNYIPRRLKPKTSKLVQIFIHTIFCHKTLSQAKTNYVIKKSFQVCFLLANRQLQYDKNSTIKNHSNSDV